MRKKFLDDLPWKIVSLLAGILIWFVVVTVNDPIIRVSYEVPVQVVNESYIASGKKTYQIEDAYQTVLVTVRGNSSVVNKLKQDDLSVIADMTQIVNMDTNPVYVPITASCKNISTENISTATTTIPIIIENVDSAKFLVSIDTENTKPDKDYEIGRMKALPENVTVSGPESLIQKISSIVATVDVSNMRRSGNVSAVLQVIDKNQDAMSASQMEFLSFDSGSRSVDVNIELWKKKTDVGLQVAYSGAPAAGYQVSSVTTTPEKVTVAGTDSELAALEQNGWNLMIPAKLVSVSGKSEDMEVTIDMAEVLTENPDLKIANGTSSQVVVHVSIISNTTREYQLDVDTIQLRNLDKKLSVSFDMAQVEVRVNSTVLQRQLSADEIILHLDCGSYMPGDYTAELQVELPDGFTLEETPMITIHVKESVENPGEKESRDKDTISKELPLELQQGELQIDPLITN